LINAPAAICNFGRRRDANSRVLESFLQRTQGVTPQVVHRFCLICIKACVGLRANPLERRSKKGRNRMAVTGSKFVQFLTATTALVAFGTVAPASAQSSDP